MPHTMFYFAWAHFSSMSPEAFTEATCSSSLIFEVMLAASSRFPASRAPSPGIPLPT